MTGNRVAASVGSTFNNVDAAAAGADRSLRAGERPPARAAQLQQARRRRRGARRLALQPLRLRAAAQVGAVPADQRRVRRERPVQRLLEGLLAAGVRRRSDDGEQRRASRSPTRCTSSTAASTCCDRHPGASGTIPAGARPGQAASRRMRPPRPAATEVLRLVEMLLRTEATVSGRPDLNRGPHRPERCALPSCATPRVAPLWHALWEFARL